MTIKEAIETIKIAKAEVEWEYPMDYQIAFDIAITTLKHSKQKRGKWVRHDTYYGDDTSGSIDPDWRCSECGKQAIVNAWMLYDLTDFYPNCGVDMRGK